MRNGLICLVTGFVVSVILAGCVRSESRPPSGPPPTAEAAQNARMDWWREARFGMFIHWGLYAIPAGEWGEAKNHGEWIRDSARIPVEEYEKLVPRFNPVKFNADEWVALAKEAGVKYIVITSKHHDGFCLFDSQQTDFDVMATPFHRDIMKELAEACAKAGIRMCWYHSIMDWHHPDYLPRRPWERTNRPETGADFSCYVAYLKDQLRELLTHYGPIGVLWFDGQWEGTWTNELGQDLEAYVRLLQPDIIINSRVGRGGGPYGIDRSQGGLGDYGTPEQFIPEAAMPGMDWETCMTMNDHWGYNKNDANWKSSKELIRMLIDIASKGGNFLLNVGPTAEGLIPQPSVERMRDIGAWLKVNGEAIYGTQAGPFKQSPAWGRCTQRLLDGSNTRLYLHVFDAPSEGKLVLGGLLNQPKQAYLLTGGSEAAVEARRVEDRIEVDLPRMTPTKAAFVMVLDLVGRPDVGDAPAITADFDVFTDSLDVTIRTDQANVELHYTMDGAEPTAQSPRATGPVKLTRTSIVKARSFRGAQPVSPPSSAEFKKVSPRRAEAIEGAEPGLTYAYYEGEFTALPDFSAIKPVADGSTEDFSVKPARRDDVWALRFEGWVNAPKTGPYRFFVRSDDGSRLWIGDELVVDNDGLHSSFEKCGTIVLEAGLHVIRVAMFERTGGDELVVSWQAPGLTKQQIPVGALWRRPGASPSTQPDSPPSFLGEPQAGPTPEQLAWQDSEIGMFIHFAPNTYTDQEYDDLSLPLEKFNPAPLDTDQWVAAAEGMSAKYIVFVAKHAGGFCMWPTATTDYSVKHTPWRGGAGDVLRDLSESCRKRGMKLGVYVSPCDRRHGAESGGRCQTPEAQEAYNKLYRQQLTEVLGRYGEMFEVWFDGSIVVPVGDILKQYAPRAMVFQGPHATIRWVGNEEGIAPYPAWNALSEKAARSGEATGMHGEPNGLAWLPLECDARIRSTWFWNTKNADTLKTIDQLVEMYYHSVGHGAVLLLNQTPDTTGRIPDRDVKRGAELAAELRRRFGRSVAETTGSGDLVELTLPTPEEVDHVVTMEDIAQGERVREYVIEGFTGGVWKPLCQGTAIGHKKIDRFTPAEVDKLRLRVLKSAGRPLIRRLAAFRVAR